MFYGCCHTCSFKVLNMHCSWKYHGKDIPKINYHIVSIYKPKYDILERYSTHIDNTLKSEIEG